MKQKLPLIVAVIALTTAVFGIFRDPSTPQPPQNQKVLASAPSPAFATQQEDAQPVQVLPTPLPADSDDARLALLRDIQTRLLAMESTINNMKGGWEGLARRGLVPLSDEDKAKFQQQAIDMSRPIEERLSALRLLRRHNGVTDEVAQSLAQSALNSTDPKIKEEIFEQMDGVTNAVLQGVLLTAIADEQDAGVRRRIADALSPFSSDPDVQAWLRHLTESDPDERVKREAQQALTQRLERMDPAGLQQVVLDDQVSDQEKLAALGRLRREDARTPEVVASMVELYNGMEDSRMRVEIIRQLDGVTDPVLKQPLLNGLAQDENARIREEAADALAAYKSDPNVEAWLKYAAANDPDPRVQRQAQSSLDGTNNDDRRREWTGRGGDRGRRGR